jgi:enoyl-CoA hydratase/carnithine racemase
MPELVLVERSDAIATVAINRPQVLNCLSFQTLSELRAAVAQLAADEEVRAVILTGAGERAFCTGADLKERRTLSEEQVRGTCSDIAALPMPTIAAVNGVAFGGGLELTLACDLRVLAPHATMGLTEVSLAIIPGAGGTQRLPRLIGKGLAKEMILTARRISPEYALSIGLANRVAGPGEVLLVARDLAAQIAANGPVAVRAAKRAIDRGLEMSLPEGLIYETECYRDVIPTEDRREALAAFAEKRKPVFKGR